MVKIMTVFDVAKIQKTEKNKTQACKDSSSDGMGLWWWCGDDEKKRSSRCDRQIKPALANQPQMHFSVFPCKSSHNKPITVGSGFRLPE